MVQVKMGGLKRYDVDIWPPSLGAWPVYPYAVEETVRNAAHSYSEDNCVCLLIVLLLEGDLSYRCGDMPECVVSKGDIFLIPSGSSYQFSTTAGRFYHKIVLELQGTLLSQVSEALGLGSPLHFRCDFMPRLEREILALGKLVKAGRPEEVSSMVAMTSKLLVELSLAAKTSPDNDMRLLAKAKALLEQGNGSKGIAEIASSLGVCPSTLNKLFNRKLGLSPVKYRIQRKMERAESLLLRSALTIKEISLRLGYARQIYFSADFKRFRGISPKEFRIHCRPTGRQWKARKCGPASLGIRRRRRSSERVPGAARRRNLQSCPSGVAS